MDKAFYRVGEVCELLACGRSQLYRWLASKELAYCKLGRSTRISAAALEEFVAKRIEAGHEPERRYQGRQ